MSTFEQLTNDLTFIEEEGAKIQAFLPRISDAFASVPSDDEQYTVTIEVTEYGDPLLALSKLHLNGWTYTAPAGDSHTGSLVYKGTRFPREVELVNALHKVLRNL